MLNLYKVERQDNVGYDEYDAFIVASASVEQAKLYAPNGGLFQISRFPCWSVKNLEVTLIGQTELPEGEIVLASFNAG